MSSPYQVCIRYLSFSFHDSHGRVVSTKGMQTKGNIIMASGWIGKKERKAIYDRDDCTCCYCGTKCLIAAGMPIAQQKAFQKENAHKIATLDHIVSQWEIAQTAESDVDFRRKIQDPKNLVTVCNKCNSSKKHTPLYIWADRMGFDYSSILERIAQRTH